MLHYLVNLNEFHLVLRIIPLKTTWDIRKENRVLRYCIIHRSCMELPRMGLALLTMQVHSIFNF